MRYTIERYISNVDGIGYEFCTDVFEELLCKMRDKISHLFTGEDYHNLIFIMNLPFYNRFSIACQVKGRDSDMYRGIRITVNQGLDMGGQVPCGIVRLVYKEPDVKLAIDFWTNQSKIKKGFYSIPHIDHVKFNGPATIVFWKDGTKTVVKHDGKGRKDKKMAVLYAFIRKIYGEGRPYHNILNEIEEAVK